jgi:hypothetical protein
MAPGATEVFRSSRLHSMQSNSVPSTFFGRLELDNRRMELGFLVSRPAHRLLSIAYSPLPPPPPFSKMRLKLKCRGLG